MKTINYEVVSTEEPIPFHEIWNRYIIPLKGKTIIGETVLENKILTVSNSEITRMSKNGKLNKIPIEPFKFAYKQILEKGQVTRKKINQEFVSRISSGVVLVLSNIPIFTVTKNPLIVKFK